MKTCVTGAEGHAHLIKPGKKQSQWNGQTIITGLIARGILKLMGMGRGREEWAKLRLGCNVDQCIYLFLRHLRDKNKMIFNIK